MKNFFKKLWALMNDPKYEKSFLIALPCMAVLIAALILMPQIKAVARGGVSELPEASQLSEPEEEGEKQLLIPGGAVNEEKESQPSPTAKPRQEKQETAPAASPRPSAPAQTERPRETYKPRPTEAPAPRPGNNDAIVTVPESNDSPAVPVITPAPAPSDEDVAHVQIKDITELVTIIEDTELPQAEREQIPEAPVQTFARMLTTAPEAMGEDVVLVEQVPKLDAQGNQVYTYQFRLGPNGRLVYADTLEESETIPVDENNDGVPEYGLYEVIPTTPEEGSESELSANGYYVSENLYNSDNTPIEKYVSLATPVYNEVSIKVGWHRDNGELYYYDSEGNMVTGLNKIDGKLYYFNEYGVKAKSLGIDVSFYNGDINWQSVKAQGIDFAIVRVGGRTWGSGQMYNDSMAAENLREAHGAGLKVGAYYYSTAITPYEAVQEASYALDKISGVPLSMPIFIDMEFSGDRPNGRSDTLSPSQRTAIVNAFCETVQNSGYTPGVYSGQYFFQNEMEYSQVSKYTTWLASYTRDNKLPAFYNPYDIWQFTDRGSINGIKGNVDMNVIY